MKLSKFIGPTSMLAHDLKPIIKTRGQEGDPVPAVEIMKAAGTGYTFLTQSFYPTEGFKV